MPIAQLITEQVGCLHSDGLKVDLAEWLFLNHNLLELYSDRLDRRTWCVWYRLCCNGPAHSPELDPIALVSNQTYITYQMVTSIIEAASEMSLWSIEYLTVYSIMAIGPAAEYSSECIRMSACIRISVCRVAQGQEACGSSRELEWIIELYRVISKCKKVWFTDRCVGVNVRIGPAA